jgi:hypothetical protein
MRSYVTNRQSRVRSSGTLFRPFQVVSGVLQGSLLEPIVFKLIINNICNSLNHCKFLFSADGLNIFRVISSLLPSDINSASDWCAANSSKTIVQSYEYQLRHAGIARTSSVKDLSVFLIQNYIFAIVLISHFLNAQSYWALFDP